MPDTTPHVPQTTEAPPSEDDWRPDLPALRARLDAIDDQLHDLLMRRAMVIEAVARSGKAAAFRPGREAAILRRLLARHTGGLPPRTLVRMWREMLAGTTAMQAPFSVVAFDPTADGAIASVAREHFGALTPVACHSSSAAALNAVRRQTATVAVIPYRHGDATNAAPTSSGVGDWAWWSALTEAKPRLFVVARLPFWGDRPEHVPVADALVVAATPPDASGFDRAFVAMARADDKASFIAAGLTPRAIDGVVVELDGMLEPDDPRLPAGAVVLGGYAVPTAGDDA